MFEELLKYKSPVYFTLMHVLIGIGCLFSNWVIIGWFYFILASNINVFFFSRSPFYPIALMTYLVSFEVLGRMVGTSPIIPYETSKYFMVGFFLWNILIGKADGNIGWLMLVLIIPGMFYDESGEVGYQNIVFNALGPIAIAMGLIYFRSTEITQVQFISLLRMIALPLISSLAFVFVKTPDYDQISFDLSANFDTAGGFGSNQVSTIFGLGGLLAFMFFIFRWRLTGNRITDIGLFFMFSFQGLLTFSRGGVIGMALAILVLLYLLTQAGLLVKTKFKLPNFTQYVFPIAFAAFFAFEIADDITGGNLSLRYQGETYGTSIGAKEKDLNTITTNRLNIFREDIELFNEYGIWGVGVGASQRLRGGNISEGTAAHVELSRLIAEHGILGIIYFILLILVYFMYVRTVAHPVHKAILACLFILALYSTFHAATRTFVTPLLFGLSMIRIKTDG